MHPLTCIIKILMLATYIFHTIDQRWPCALSLWYALDNNGDFKVHFRIPIFKYCKYVLSTMELFITCLGFRPCRGFDVLVVSIPTWKNLQCHLFEIWKGKQGELHSSCIGLTSLMMIFFSHVCFLRWIFGNHKCANYVSLVIDIQSMKRVDPFCPRVDEVLDCRLIIGGSTSPSFDRSAWRLVSV
jgi:hypothetical protein